MAEKQTIILIIIAMIKDFLYVAAGGALGSVLRYGVSCLLGQARGFPWGTFTVNLLGSFLIGVFFGYMAKNPNLGSGTVLFLSVGFCGGFTTFSTFSKEGLQLLQVGNYLMLLLYLAGSVILGIALAALGYFLAK